MRYRPDIDGLRAIAILPVVFFHAGIGLSGGFVGVDIFFVISGYLLSSIVIAEIAENRFSFLAFYERRIRRLAPALIVVLALSFAAAWRLMLPDDFVDFAHSALAAIFVFANFHFYGSIDYFSQSAELMPLLHTWSLAIEEQFYAVLPLALLTAGGLFPRRWLPGLVALALLVSFVLCIHYTSAHRPFAFYMPHTRAWELLAGTLLAALPRLAVSSRVANILGIAALLAIALIVVTFDERDPFPGWMALGPVLATAALIACGSAPAALSSRFLSSPPMVFIGRISYSLYLWHWPVIVFVNYSGLAADSTATKLSCIGLSFLLASLSWAFVEEPIRRRRILKSRVGVYGTAASMAAVLAVAAASVLWSAGAPGRLPAQLTTLLDAERYQTEAQECFLLRAAALTEAPCLRGAPEPPPSFLLIGDSHAFALSPGLFRAASEAGLSGLQFTSDGFFPGPGRKTLGASHEDPRIARALEITAEHPEIPTLILAGAWADYATGSNWKGKRWLYEDEIAAADSSAANIALFERALERLIAALPERQILLLDDIAAGSALDLKAFARQSMLRPRDRESAVLPYAEALARRAVYEPILQALAERHENVSYIPVFADFCRPPGCPLFSEDLSRPIYRDGDHLSNQAALLWKDRFAERVLPQLGERAARETSPEAGPQ